MYNYPFENWWAEQQELHSSDFIVAMTLESQYWARKAWYQAQKKDPKYQKGEYHDLETKSSVV